MVSRFSGLAAITLSLTMSGGVAAQDSAPQNPPQAILTLSGCLNIVTSAERLACLETATRALESAIRDGDVLVVDQNLASEARRQAFGTNSAPIDVLQSVQPTDRIDSIETTLSRASQGADDRWTFFLADGSVWTQVGSDRVSIRNREGEPVRVRRAAMGSYLLVVGRSVAVRVRRR